MYQVQPKKKLGQHFLTDMSIASDIADTIDVEPTLPVLEIGPGMGALTQFLLKKKRELRVVEIDDESSRYLKEHFPLLRGSIIEDDFLKMELGNLFGGKPFVLTGNYPYNISSQIFFKMLDYRDLIPCCTGMLQKEVAERLTSAPGKKSYGILSVLLQAWYDTEYLFTVPESVFNPPPKVKSAVVRFRRNETTDLGCNEKLFKRIVKATFNQRRKMLRSSLRQLFAQLDNESGLVVDKKRHDIFLSYGGMEKRPEQLSVQDFICLTNAVEAERRQAC